MKGKQFLLLSISTTFECSTRNERQKYEQTQEILRNKNLLTLGECIWLLYG